MKQIYIGKVDKLRHMNVNIYDCRSGKLWLLYISPKKLKKVINYIKTKENIKIFKMEGEK